MKLTRTLGSACYFPLLLIAFVLIGVLQHNTFAQIHDEGGDVKDRIAIQEKLYMHMLIRMTRKIA